LGPQPFRKPGAVRMGRDHQAGPAGSESGANKLAQAVQKETIVFIKVNRMNP
jgi:hypothetical protein